ncbi:MAG: hypothetical protein H7Y19_12330 [Luteimonas sp.]|nr:hypothetical protein [Luteimonas sp.]
MQQLARISVGDAWLALANFYAEHHPEDPALATDAYRNALQCKDGFDRPSLADDEYDRRRLLGVGTTQDLKALAKEWKSWHFPGYGRKTQLAWIHACGPTELRDLKEAWWWLAVAEARWSHCKDIALPTLSVSELRELLVSSVRNQDRHALQEKAKDYAHAEFVSGK